MSKNMYATVGNWNFKKEAKKGLTVLKYEEETGALEYVEHYFESIVAGQQCFDPESKILYIVDEIADSRGMIGGGGYILALSINEKNGEVKIINEKKSLSPKPSYFCLDKSKKYALVSNHASRNYVTKVVKDEHGKYDTETQFDDVTITLFRINDDGSIGEACDVSILKGEGNGRHAIPHPHSVVGDPTSEIFIVCDKGMDKIYSYGLDRENGKLIFKDELIAEEGYAPRYSSFNKKLPIVYCNNENKPVVYTVGYDIDSGKLHRIQKVDVLIPEDDLQEEMKGSCSDIIVHPNNKYLYVSVRNANKVSVFDIDEKGEIAIKQVIDCGGDNPRGLHISPNGKHLYAMNVMTSNIAGFEIAEDGTLTALENGTKTNCPGNMLIFEL